ncbi:hypothetical protein [Puia dinghuensis]|uniref:Uncharacterized protein n=1 Tax=Puia dinghuensis TaxID=1792502 RepID=A0A8J2XQF1_9BACT|nr:hypothetical protein [Puia dinghuensis]GGA92592.1 hypothetical protein GCM10011511_14960 [Puia dinghuensis]
MSIDQFKQEVKQILLNAGITPDVLETNCQLPRHNGIEIGYRILCAADLPIGYALTAIYGPLSQKECEHELSDICGFGELYDTACIRHCILLGAKWVNGDQWCEVGMKYPTFFPTRFIKKWKLTWVGEYESPSCNTIFDIWENPDKSMIWSCEKGRLGQGGYAGLIFHSFEHALQFVEWYVGNPSHYVKDIDMFINGLGGMDIEKYLAFQAQLEASQRLSHSATLKLTENIPFQSNESQTT